MTPRIYSGDYWFEIRDLICPYPLEASIASSNETLFEFPFNNPQKTFGHCFVEIATCLRGLKDNVLLFLNNIQSIVWNIDGHESGGLCREVIDDYTIKILSQHGKSEPTKSYWLRFQKEVNVKDDDGIMKACCVAVAYSLVGISNAKNNEPEWRILPLQRGQVSIYFPAEKETSNLRFHIHAPFASTIARDSVRDCHANNQLRDHIAELIADSLIIIRDAGMLTVNFLAVLPVPADNLSAFYKPIQSKIIHTFMLKDLTPLKMGGYKAARSIFKGPARISDLIDDGELSKLIAAKQSPPLWVANAPQANQREDQFFNSLGITTWGWDELGTFLTDVSMRTFIQQWLSNKDDVWLQRFYSLLNHGIENAKSFLWSHSVGNSFRALPLVRVINGGTEDHVIPKEAFFPGESMTLYVEGVPFVKESVYVTARSDMQKTSARIFLEKVGVSQFDTRAAIDLILKSYYKSAIDIETHIEHLNLFITYWKNNQRTCDDLFKSNFLLRNKLPYDQTNHYCKPSELCLDEPFESTGLSGLIAIHKKNTLWKEYKSKFSDGIFSDFVSFLKANGVMYTLLIEQIRIPYNHPSQRDLRQDSYKFNVRTSTYEVNIDFYITQLDQLLETNSIASGRLIWEAILKADKKVAKAIYRPNAKYSSREADSSLVIKLKNISWIPDNGGGFRKPQDMTRDALRPDFPFDDRNGLLTAIGFGDNVKKQTEEYLKQKDYADKLGIPLEIAEQLKKMPTAKKSELFQKWQDDIHSFFNPQPIDPLPSSAAPNLDKRAAKAIEAAEEADEKNYELKSRSVKTTGISKEKKAYLKDHNANDNGYVYCQLCHSRVPFAIKGVDHFEAIEFVRAVTKEIPANALALCPNCAAEYTLACTTPEQERIEQLLSLDSKTTDEAEWTIPLELPVHTHIRFFSQKHLIDLQGAIKYHLENQNEVHSVDGISENISSSAVQVKTTLSVASQSQITLSRQSSVKIETDISSISDKRVVRAIAGVSKLYSHDKSVVFSKVSEIIKRFIKSDELSVLMNREGVHVTTLKMAVDYLIPGLNIQPYGFGKYPQFIDHICKSTGCAFLYFKTPADFRISSRTTPFPGYSRFDSNYTPPAATNNSRPTVQKTIQNKANVRVYVPPAPAQKHLANRCKFCGSRAIAGSDVCYSCG